jgi:hypothetical protein
MHCAATQRRADFWSRCKIHVIVVINNNCVDSAASISKIAESAVEFSQPCHRVYLLASQLVGDPKSSEHILEQGIVALASLDPGESPVCLTACRIFSDGNSFLYGLLRANVTAHPGAESFIW